jgi:hypothetical protein
MKKRSHTAAMPYACNIGNVAGASAAMSADIGRAARIFSVTKYGVR